jgi:hypothetical protein
MRWLLVCLVGCAMGEGADVTRNRPGGDPNQSSKLPDGGGDLAGVDFAPESGGDSGTTDLGDSGTTDLASTGTVDLATATDLGHDLTTIPGVITGGACASGATGATAIRVHWTNGGGQAFADIEAFGMPDTSREKVGAFGFNVGFTPTFGDNFLAEGGLVLDGSDFVDIELSTVGVSAIRAGTLAIFGRSFATGASGSFNWQSFTGTGQTPADFVSNSVPYRWYAADLDGAIAAADGNVLVRVKAGPSSGSLSVNRIEICLDAN